MTYFLEKSHLKNAIQILVLKKEGKQRISAEEFLKGNKIKVGVNLENNG